MLFVSIVKYSWLYVCCVKTITHSQRFEARTLGTRVAGNRPSRQTRAGCLVPNCKTGCSLGKRVHGSAAALDSCRPGNGFFDAAASADLGTGSVYLCCLMCDTDRIYSNNFYVVHS